MVQLCTELAEGKVLPAGWTSGYDTKQKRLYFVDEVSAIAALVSVCSALNVFVRRALTGF